MNFPEDIPFKTARVEIVDENGNPLDQLKSMECKFEDLLFWEKSSGRGRRGSGCIGGPWKKAIMIDYVNGYFKIIWLGGGGQPPYHKYLSPCR